MSHASSTPGARLGLEACTVDFTHASCFEHTPRSISAGVGARTAGRTIASWCAFETIHLEKSPRC